MWESGVATGWAWTSLCAVQRTKVTALSIAFLLLSSLSEETLYVSMNFLKEHFLSKKEEIFRTFFLIKKCPRMVMEYVLPG